MSKNLSKSPMKIALFCVSFLLVLMTAFSCFLLTRSSFLKKDLKISSPLLSSTKKQTVIVTGASGALGSAAAKELSSLYDLILTGRNIIKLKALQLELEKAHPEGKYDVCILDYSSDESILRFQEGLKKNNVKVAGFVLIGPRPPFAGKDLFQDRKVWQTVFLECFIGPFESLKAASPFFSEKSSVVVLSGVTSIELYPFCGPGSAIRSMVSVYTKALSKDFALQGKKVRYNAISPGVILTDHHEKRIKAAAEKNKLSYEQQMKVDVANIPSKQHPKPEDLAKVIAFLISDDSKGINGVNLPFDGGWSKSLR